MGSKVNPSYVPTLFAPIANLSPGIAFAAAAVKGLRPLRDLLRKPLTAASLRLYVSQGGRKPSLHSDSQEWLTSAPGHRSNSKVEAREMP